jgi:hypothetical protein
MPRPIDDTVPIPNHLLAALPDKSYRRLLPDLRLVRLELGHVVATPGTVGRYVYFPTTAVLSMLCTMKNGEMVEIGMVGNEGTTAMATCLGVEAAATHTIVQMAGDALRIRSTKVKAEFDRGGAFHDLVLRYIYALVAQVSQSVGCNTHHLLEARLSRWLLIVRDRVPSDKLFLQHEFLSQMLGTGRSAVTVAAGTLRAAGLIRYSRGKITILDRDGLEASACECYGVVKAAFEHANLG